MGPQGILEAVREAKEKLPSGYGFRTRECPHTNRQALLIEWHPEVGVFRLFLAYGAMEQDFVAIIEIDQQATGPELTAAIDVALARLRRLVSDRDGLPPS